MTRTRSSAQKRLIQAALELFTSQGFSATTTRQIADQAEVNEATLFRNFGSKHDLLLAVIQDSGIFVQESLRDTAVQADSISEVIKQYSHNHLQSLEQFSELLRALIGEAGQYSLENRRALGQELMGSTQDIAQSLANLIEQKHGTPRIPPEKFVGLLNSLLLGYLMTQLASEFYQIWNDQSDFLDSLVEVWLYGAVSSPETEPSAPEETKAQDPDAINSALPMGSMLEPKIADLPADLVRSILQRAKKQGPQAYAVTYLLFGAGLLPQEVLGLERSHHICNSRQNIVQINQGAIRQVPINQWIMGKRYGSYANNPLSQWLKNRKDEASAMFVNDQGQPLSESNLLELWQGVTTDLLTPDNVPPSIDQARQTWCVEMLMKGISLEDLSILSGWTTRQLQPYLRRSREKAALERAMQLDQK